MKNSNLIWGVLLLIIGGILLLYNFNVVDLDFSFRAITKLWPLWLIYGGLSVLLSKNAKYYNLLGVFGLVLIGFVLLVGFKPEIVGITPQKSFNHSWDFGNDGDNNNLNSGDQNNGSETTKMFDFSEKYSPSVKNAEFNIKVGLGEFEVTDGTTNLADVNAKTDLTGYEFSPKYNADNSSATVNLTAKDGKVEGFDNLTNEVKTKLSTVPVWVINADMGVCQTKFNLSKHKVEKFSLKAGVSDVDIKFGDLMPRLDAEVEVGASSVTVKVPKTVGCQIVAKTGISNKDFDGFVKNGDVYTTPNFATSDKKIYLSLKSGVSNLEVQLY